MLGLPKSRRFVARLSILKATASGSSIPSAVNVRYNPCLVTCPKISTHNSWRFMSTVQSAMLRPLYRYLRRHFARRFTTDSAARELLKVAPKWWFDFARNLFLTPIFAYLAVKSGKWYAYLLAHISSQFLFFYAFAPILTALMFQASKTEPHGKHYTTFSVWMVLNIFSLALFAMYLLTHLLADLQLR